MKLHLSPIRGSTPLAAERMGDTLLLNGDLFDFSDLAEGDTIDGAAYSENWFVGPVTRTDGQIILQVLLPHGANAPQETLFPSTLIIDTDGPVPLPPYTRWPD